MKKIILKIFLSNLKSKDFGFCNRSKNKKNQYIVRVNLNRCKNVKTEIMVLCHELVHFIIDSYRNNLKYKKKFSTMGRKKEMEETICLKIEEEIEYILKSSFEFKND